MPLRIAGAGSCLMDIVYADVDFSSEAFRSVASKREGDGGLSSGSFVLVRELELFAGRPFPDILRDLVGDALPAEDLGGSSAASLLHAARELEGEDVELSYHGLRGKDELGERLLERLRRASPDSRRASLDLRRATLDLRAFRKEDGPTPSLTFLSDPRADRGRGARCLAIEIGAAARFKSSDLRRDFFGADIVAFGGTSLVPALHDRLQELLPEARSRGALTVVDAAFDYRAERRDPFGPWPLGTHDNEADDFPGPAEAYRGCDLLVVGQAEALRLAGCRDLGEASSFLEGSGLGAFLVDRGSGGVLAWAREARFAGLGLTELPALAPCGRGAFVGSVLADLARQLKATPGRRLDLARAADAARAAARAAAAGAAP